MARWEGEWKEWLRGEVQPQLFLYIRVLIDGVDLAVSFVAPLFPGLDGLFQVFSTEDDVDRFWELLSGPPPSPTAEAVAQLRARECPFRLAAQSEKAPRRPGPGWRRFFRLSPGTGRSGTGRPPPTSRRCSSCWGATRFALTGLGSPLGRPMGGTRGELRTRGVPGPSPGGRTRALEASPSNSRAVGVPMVGIGSMGMAVG